MRVPVVRHGSYRTTLLKPRKTRRDLMLGPPRCYFPAMFEITGDHVARLGDADLRTLVVRLALAELAAQGLPSSAVTAGGHQDAPDGGIDVRVALEGPPPQPDFVPRAATGFQVKRPDMPASEIEEEMRPKPARVLRESIVDLARLGGAYVVVSAQGSVADQPLRNRRGAMRKALVGCADGDRLHTDFYDRERLATWANLYPGAAAWVRSRVGDALAGWRAIGAWRDGDVAEGGAYIVSGEAKVFSERTGGRDALTVTRGLDALRSALRGSGRCVRLIGMSGVGKTRFVEALFEDGAGEAPPLDPAIAVYTDYAEDISPSAREMARRLVDAGRPALLVVDNCNPKTHQELAAICSAKGSPVGLLTVEYDVRDDEPERTDVFRLVAGAGSAVEAWIGREFPDVTQVDRRTIAEFSDGNFRVARALAETLARGETLGRLRSQDLFERLFFQRQVPDQQLLRDAEALALAYSYDGEGDALDGELASLGSLVGRTVRDLFVSTAELRDRGIVQLRGRWRAVLPQAIANRLAAGALARILPADLDAFCRSAPERLVKSVSRRLGYLHDSAEARAVVDRWLRPTGPLGDVFGLGDAGMAIISNLAPASPPAVLAAMRGVLAGDRADGILAPANRARSRWMRLLRSLAYQPDLFEEAARLLARFAGVEPEGHNVDRARDQFVELFHIHLSGTRASPAQRRALARELLLGRDPDLVAGGLVALDGLLKTTHFSSSASFDFGARPRDFGWQPSARADVEAWFVDALTLATEAASVPGVASVVGRHVRGIWSIPAARPALEAAAERFARDGSWIDGWLGLRAACRWDGAADADGRQDLEALIDRLKPVGLIERARAVVLSRGSVGFDVTDGDEDPLKAYHRAHEVALELGRAMAADRDALSAFLAEVSSRQAMRAFEFGRGLGRGTEDVDATWSLLVEAFRSADANLRNPSVMGGFVAEFYKTRPDEARRLLEAALSDHEVRQRLPFLQSRTVLDADGLDRLRRLAVSGEVPASWFGDLACGVVDGAEPQALIRLLDAISALNGGVGVAADILYFRLAMAKDAGPIPAELVEHGRRLLAEGRFGPGRQSRDYHLGELVELCLAGPEAEHAAAEFCRRFREAVNAYEAHAFDSHYLVSAIFKVQPVVALDAFLDPDGGEIDDDIFHSRSGQLPPLENVDEAMLASWADAAPERRYANLGHALPVFRLENLDEVVGISEQFVAMLRRAPDKAAFLGEARWRVHPDGWAGSLAAVLERRKAVLAALADVRDPDVDAWLAAADRSIDDWIARERDRESLQEETFE